MTDDRSSGWEAVATRFAATRSAIGADVVRHWSRQVSPGCAVLDIGCGTGLPIGRTLADEGFALYGIDPSPTLLAAFRANVAPVATACEPVEDSRFFDRHFDAIVMIGVLFLLPEAAQRRVLARIAGALSPGGRLLFTAPRSPCDWTDVLTGRPSRSLGEPCYRAVLASTGGRIDGFIRDDGGNDYFDATTRD